MSHSLPVSTETQATLLRNLHDEPSRWRIDLADQDYVIYKRWDDGEVIIHRLSESTPSPEK